MAQRALTDNDVELVTSVAGMLLAGIALQLVADSAFAFVPLSPTAPDTPLW